ADPQHVRTAWLAPLDDRPHVVVGKAVRGVEDRPPAVDVAPQSAAERGDPEGALGARARRLDERDGLLGAGRRALLPLVPALAVEDADAAALGADEQAPLAGRGPGLELGDGPDALTGNAVLDGPVPPR